MNAITVCEPYASALMGPKRIENRKQRWKHRGPLLIHAGLSRRFMNTLTLAEMVEWPDYDESKLKFGFIIGKVDVVDCEPYDKEKHTSVWAQGPNCLITENPQRLVDPIPYLGARGIFDVPDALLEKAKFLPCSTS